MSTQSGILDSELQYFLRIFAVAITILVNSKWYRSTYPDKRNIYLVLIPILILGLYFDYLSQYEYLFVILVVLIAILVFVGIL